MAELLSDESLIKTEDIIWTRVAELDLAMSGRGFTVNQMIADPFKEAYKLVHAEWRGMLLVNRLAMGYRVSGPSFDENLVLRAALMMGVSEMGKFLLGKRGNIWILMDDSKRRYWPWELEDPYVQRLEGQRELEGLGGAWNIPPNRESGNIRVEVDGTITWKV